ncbi:hypothetical protein HDU87_007353 [Geranomyces variabilis]|uniref:Uncharacterized protein n=1 Tax=Geranomyces variabilis TaxID=109894 RepID=A0AAD5XKD2_9FUNG|nr:hypothetical protein HDU87_007353 [Geranomyces variabilis]
MSNLPPFALREPTPSPASAILKRNSLHAAQAAIAEAAAAAGSAAVKGNKNLPGGAGRRFSATDPSAPLLGHDLTGPHTRTPPRMITGDGALIIIYPLTTDPPTFSFQLPIALDNVLPSPMYRAHVAELNALMLVTVDERRRRRWAIVALWATVTLVCLVGVFWLGLCQGQYWLAACWGILAVLFSALQMALAGYCFANLSDALQVQVDRMLAEWNARSPKNVRFAISGATTAATVPWLLNTHSSPSPPRRRPHNSSASTYSYSSLPYSYSSSASSSGSSPSSLSALALNPDVERALATAPHLLIEVLDHDHGQPRPRPLSDVVLSPDCDGAMMAVKIVPRGSMDEGRVEVTTDQPFYEQEAQPQKPPEQDQLPQEPQLQPLQDQQPPEALDQQLESLI